MKAIVVEEYEGCNEMVESDGGYDTKNDDACNASLDDYKLGDNNGLKLDMSSDDEV